MKFKCDGDGDGDDDDVVIILVNIKNMGHIICKISSNNKAKQQQQQQLLSENINKHQQQQQQQIEENNNNLIELLFPQKVTYDFTPKKQYRIEDIDFCDSHIESINVNKNDIIFVTEYPHAHILDEYNKKSH